MKHKRVISASAAALLALALTALPVAPDLAEGDLAGSAAYAKGPGGGNGGGHGGGKGGHGNGHSKAHGEGHAKARGFGHALERRQLHGLGFGHLPGLGRDRELGRGHGHGHGDGPVRNADAVSGIAVLPNPPASKETGARGQGGENAGGSDRAIADIAAALARGADDGNSDRGGNRDLIAARDGEDLARAQLY